MELAAVGLCLGLLGWLATALLGRSIYIVGRRSELENEQRALYRFAVQNAESSRIDGPIEIRLSVRDSLSHLATSKLSELVRVFAGPQVVSVQLSPSQNELVFTIPHFAPFGTIVIEYLCGNDTHEAHLALGLGPTRSRMVGALVRADLRLSSGREAGLAGRPRVPQLPLFIFSIALGLVGYMVGGVGLSTLDIFIGLLLIILVSSLIFQVSQRHIPRAIQGYACPSKIALAKQTTNSLDLALDEEV